MSTASKQLTRDRIESVLLPFIGIGAALVIWAFISKYVASALPNPIQTWEASRLYVLEPFEKRGELDQGILRFTWYSLVRVAKGYSLGLIFAVPLGLLLGLSRFAQKAFDPIVQILRPVSPLAWLPLGLVLFQQPEPAGTFAIAMCSMWPTVMNTALGIKSIPQDYLNVARVLRLSRTKTLFKILLPAAMPYMFTGFRLSLGIAWLVIVASEMLTGAPGVGGFLWQEYNSLVYEHLILCIVTIGLVGFLLDRLMALVDAREGLTMAHLELKGVGKSYVRGSVSTEVLRDINLTMERGELVAIVGHSGAGKSTLVSLIAGLITPDSGTIRFRGEPVRGPGPDRGIVFQNYSLLPWMTVHENVLLGVEQVLSGASREKQREHTDRYVAMVGLAAARDKKPSQLSGGMRQRVAVARALAMEPEILLLDEPLSALDALTRGNLQMELDRICRSSGKTILLITNDVDEGLLLADRIVPLGAGPGASLGPSFVIDLPRPRDRRALNHDKRFKELRGEVIDYLLRASRGRTAAVAAKGAQA